MPSPTNPMVDTKGSGSIHEMLMDVSQKAREDIDQTNDPRARALFETTAEVLDGLAKAYKDFDEGTEAAWRR